MSVLPFLPEFEEPIRTGRKTMTARTKRYEPGEYQTPFDGLRVRVHAVGLLSLGEVAEKCWEFEGVSSPDAFIEVWNRLHPRAGFDPARPVYLHIFTREGS